MRRRGRDSVLVDNVSESSAIVVFQRTCRDQPQPAGHGPLHRCRRGTAGPGQSQRSRRNRQPAVRQRRPARKSEFLHGPAPPIQRLPVFASDRPDSDAAAPGRNHHARHILDNITVCSGVRRLRSSSGAGATVAGAAGVGSSRAVSDAAPTAPPQFETAAGSPELSASVFPFPPPACPSAAPPGRRVSFEMRR